MRISCEFSEYELRSTSFFPHSSLEARVTMLISIRLLSIVVILASSCVFANAEYNNTDSIQMVIYSAISHCKMDDIRAWNCAGCKLIPNFKVLNVFKNKVTDVGFIGVDIDNMRIITSFLGTYNFQTVFQDFALARTHFSNATHDVMVHDGWYHGWKELREMIFQEITLGLQAYPGASVWITGHSLGGSLAEIAAVDVTLSLKVPVTLYGFGTPRVGNEAWAKLVQETLNVHYRVTHRQDLIPLYPPRAVGYHHPTQEVWFDNDSEDNFKLCSDTDGEDPHCNDSTIVPDLLMHLRYLNRHITNCDAALFPK